MTRIFGILALIAACGGSPAAAPPVLAPYVVAVSAPVVPNISGGCTVTISLVTGQSIAVHAGRGGFAQDTLWTPAGRYNGTESVRGYTEEDFPLTITVPGRSDQEC